MSETNAKEKICVLLTGGTICSVPNSNGKNTSDAGQASPELINHFLNKTDSKSRIKDLFDTVSLKTDILSENMTTDVWYEILEIFRTNILPGNYKGVIVLHGTDTLAYTSSFLSMALAGIKIPVCMVSAQLRLGRYVNDEWIPDEKTNGYANFRAAVELIMNGIAPNVYAVYRNEANEYNGLHEPGELLVHYGAHLLQCPNGSNNFHSRDEMLVKDKNNAILPICSKAPENIGSEKKSGFSEGPGYYLKVKDNCSGVCLIRPFTGLDYSEIKIEGKKIVIHGTYHSESVCIGRSIYTKNEESLEDDENSRDDFHLDEIIEKDRNYSILYLLDKCANNNIPVFLAPCDKKAAAYGTTKNATERGAKTLKGITLEAAYAKAVLGCFLGIQADEFADFMSKPINDEKPEEDPA